MAKQTLNLDRERSLQDPIEFTKDGKTFTVVDYTDEIQEEVAAIADDEDLLPGESLSRQLAVLTGCDPEDFSGFEFREKSAVLQFVMGAITDPLGNRAQRRGARR